MANWKKLNKEFDKVLNNLTDKEWEEWYKHKEGKGVMKRKQLISDAKIQELKNEKRELLADFVHKQWSGWMKYLFSKGAMNDDGSWTMPPWAVERWQRQMNTDYRYLPEDEKESERKEAEAMLSILNDR